MPAQPSGYGPEVLEPFNIPTAVNAPVRTGPRMNLTFPVFTPPAASSYGSTQPMAIPWTPPNLAGAINDGLKTGASLATSFLTNRKTAQEIQAQEAASKSAIAAMHDPNLRQNISYEMGPSGFTARIISPAEAAIAKANLAKTAAETEASQATTAEKRGTTAEAQARIAQQQAETEKTKVQTGMLGQNVFQRRAAALNSGMVTSDTSDTTKTSTDGQTSTDGTTDVTY